MSVSRRRVADALVLSIGGEVDLSTAAQLGDAVTEALAQAPAVLVLDLTVAGPVAARPITVTGVQQLVAVFDTSPRPSHRPAPTPTTMTWTPPEAPRGAGQAGAGRSRPMTTGYEPDAGTVEASSSSGADAVEDLHCRSVAATPQRLDGLRRQVGEWAGRTGLAVSRVQDLVLVVYEALANVAAHAYHAEPGPLDLHARHHDGRVTVTVTDHGQWTPAPVPGLLHGRGLPLIHTLADEATFTTSPAGTTVGMSWSCTPAASPTRHPPRHTAHAVDVTRVPSVVKR